MLKKLQRKISPDQYRTAFHLDCVCIRIVLAQMHVQRHTKKGIGRILGEYMYTRIYASRETRSTPLRYRNESGKLPPLPLRELQTEKQQANERLVGNWWL